MRYGESRVRILFILCAVLVYLSCCGRVIGGEIVCAGIGQWPPMEFVDERGVMTGFTVELLQAAGRAGGFTITFLEVAEPGIVAGLLEGKYDAICSSMLNEFLRRDEIVFTTPYYMARQSMVIHGKHKIFAYDDWTGKRFGARKGTAGLREVEEMNRGLPTVYDTIDRAMEDVYTKSLDGVICDEPVALFYAHVKYRDRLRVAGYLANSKKFPVGVAVAKGNSAILEQLNNGIAAVKARGIDVELQRKWFSR